MAAELVAVNRCLQVLALRVQQGQLADASGAVALRGDVVGSFSLGGCFGSRLQGLRVVIDGAERIGDLLEGLQDNLLIVGPGFFVGGDGLAFFRPRAPPLKIGCAKAPPKLQMRTSLREAGADASAAGGKSDLRVEVGGGHSDIGAGLMHERFGSADVGRWRTSDEGRVTGSSSGRCSVSRVMASMWASAGGLPMSTAS